MTKEEAINVLIKDADTNLISDGYHTFGELYEHRIVLFIALCKMYNNWRAYTSGRNYVWRSLKHSDGTSFEGWFVLGMFDEKGKQITYHLPMSKWDECAFAKTIDQSPEFDGHTAGDVLERVKNLN